ncbi:hypothetical protein [Heyndrickxia oleronia]|jgi:hypothetical protein|uniref:hypothetical protein n=1 Tax=Heyndrickxia oleronia TaxID=38875 RepID=UPI00242EDD38|nr:hypothetical protein [Heyndrickxia oleronia]MCI1763652.1 hypothetical protein [Heyndrickxia oleronia]
MNDQYMHGLLSSGSSVPWIGDWSAYETVHDWTGTLKSTNGKRWVTFLELYGEGYLTFCRGFSATTAASNPDIRVTIDGQEAVFEGILGNTYHGNILLQPLYFKNSVKIEIFNRHTTSLNFGCDYTVLKRIAEPVESVQTYLNTGSRKMTYAALNSTVLTDVLNISGSGYLVGLLVEGQYSVSGDIRGKVTVDGQDIIPERILEYPSSTTYRQGFFNGPIRFNNSLQIQCRTSNAGTYYKCRAWYTLD